MRKYLIMGLAVVLGLGLTVDVSTNRVTGEKQVTLVYIQEAVAKRFGGGGFSSRSVKVTRYSAPKTRTKASRTNTAKTAKATAPKPRKVTPFERAGKRQASKQAAAKSREKFTTTTSPAQARNTVSTARTTPLGSRLDKVDRTSYYSKREAAQARYAKNSTVPQTVIYRSSSSFGMYDSWFMWHVVLSDHSFGYHHYNDPGYSQWRREARRLSADNAELRAQLDAHEQAIAGMNGTRNGEYLPAGIDGDVIFAPAMVEAAVPQLTLCTGLTTGNYFKAGSGYSNLAANSAIKVAATRGSVQNLELIKAGKCDAAFVQRDAYLVFDKANPNSDFHLTRLGTLYREDAHLVCSRESEVDHLAQLNGVTDVQLYVGELGSGAAVTWSNFVTLNDDFAGLKVVNKPMSDTSFGAVNHCGLYVGKSNSKAVSTLNANKFRLVDIETVEANEIKDPSGEKVYSVSEVAGGTYKTQHGWNDSGMFTSTPTISVPVDFVVSDRWKNATTNPDAALTELSNLIPAVVGAL